MKNTIKTPEQALENALQLSMYCYHTFYLEKAGYSLNEAEELMNVNQKFETQSDPVKEITKIYRKYIERVDKNRSPQIDGSFILIKMVARSIEDLMDSISEEYFQKQFMSALHQTTTVIIQNLVNKGKSPEEVLKILRLTDAFNLHTVH